jgi:hypothetical protein
LCCHPKYNPNGPLGSSTEIDVVAVPVEEFFSDLPRTGWGGKGTPGGGFEGKAALDLGYQYAGNLNDV